jgi:hypothetical protein
MRWFDSDKDGTSDNICFFTHDANMNLTAALETDGDILERYEYTAYGQVSILNGGTPDSDGSEWSADPDNISDIHQEVLFAGYRHNPETGNYQVRYREYNPALAKPISNNRSLPDIGLFTQDVAPKSTLLSRGIARSMNSLPDLTLPIHHASRLRLFEHQSLVQMAAKCADCGEMSAGVRRSPRPFNKPIAPTPQPIIQIPPPDSGTGSGQNGELPSRGHTPGTAHCYFEGREYLVGEKIKRVTDGSCRRVCKHTSWFCGCDDFEGDARVLVTYRCTEITPVWYKWKEWRKKCMVCLAKACDADPNDSSCYQDGVDCDY